MDKSLEEAKKMNAKSRPSKSAQSGSSYTDMNESALQQARQENKKSANSATNSAMNSATNSAMNYATNFATDSVMPSSGSGMPGDPAVEEARKANEKSRQNKGK